MEMTMTLTFGDGILSLRCADVHSPDIIPQGFSLCTRKPILESFALSLSFSATSVRVSVSVSLENATRISGVSQIYRS
jgi:hypothetical protein